MSAIMFTFKADRVALRVLDTVPSSELCVDAERYNELEFPEPRLGFYDWIRDALGKIVGFRLWIAKGREVPFALIPDRNYVFRDDQEVVAVMFSDVRVAVDEAASAGQNFGESRAFVGPDQSLVLVVTAEDLDNHELSSLRPADDGRGTS